jgi:hypothetical protein
MELAVTLYVGRADNTWFEIIIHAPINSNQEDWIHTGEDIINSEFDDEDISFIGVLSYEYTAPRPKLSTVSSNSH